MISEIRMLPAAGGSGKGVAEGSGDGNEAAVGTGEGTGGGSAAHTLVLSFVLPNEITEAVNKPMPSGIRANDFPAVLPE